MKVMALMLSVCSMGACALEEGQIDGDAVAADEQSIIGGTTDTGDSCVVALLIARGLISTDGGLCTGTVIGPHTVLTAAHCLEAGLLGTVQVITILSGTTATLPGIVASSFTFDPLFNRNDLLSGHDIGIVHTANTLPFPVCGRGALNTSLPLRLVGYGSNSHANTGSGTKRQVTTNIVDFDDRLILNGNSNQQACHGDSGGPAFQTINGQEVVVGVTSFGSDRGLSVCFDGAFHDRVDAVAAFIDANTN
jgi:secreted trypsin-like serine protease